MLAAVASLGIGGVIGAVVKDLLERKRRADAIGLKLLDAKLAAYEKIQPALVESLRSTAYQVAVRESAPGSSVAEEVNRAADAAYDTLWGIERQHLHVLSSRVIGALANYREARMHLLARVELGEAAPEFHAAVVELNAAIRSDCKTDALDRNAENMLASLEKDVAASRARSLAPPKK
jgi:hypothetical protein